MMKRILPAILILLTGCHLYDAPFIGWRLEVEAQRRDYEEYLEGEQGLGPVSDDQDLGKSHSNADHSDQLPPCLHTDHHN